MTSSLVPDPQSSAFSDPGQWRLLFERAQEGFLVAELIRDAHGNAIDWLYVDVNKAWEDLTGRSRHSVLGQRKSVVSPDDALAWVEAFARVVDTGEAIDEVWAYGPQPCWHRVHAFALGGERFAVMVSDVTRVRLAEARRSALLELDDQLRDLEDLEVMAHAAASVIGTTLQVDRAGYATLQSDGRARVDRDWTVPGICSVTGVHQMHDYGSFIEDLQSGVDVVVRDTHEDPRTRNGTATLDQLSVASLVNLPLLEGGRLVAFFFVTHRVPRQWSDVELDFVRSVAARTRSAVERRRAELGLRELAVSLEQQVEARTQERDRIWQVSQDMLGVADDQGIWISVNPAWRRILGWPVEQIVGNTSEWLEHPDDRAKTRAEIERLAAGHTTFGFENRFRTADGRYRLLHWTAVTVEERLYCVARDITDERQREQALIDSRDFTRLALAAVSGVGVWTYDIGLDRFFCDSAIAELYGLDPQIAAAGILREEFLENIHPDDLGPLMALMRGGLDRGGDLELEYRIRHPDGSIRWVLSRGHTYFEGGKPVRRTGVGVDMTRQRQLEQQLRQSQKMEAVGQLTGGLAHDFNNLLTSITASLDLLERRLQSGDRGELQRYVRLAQGASQRAASVTHRLLAFSRRQTLDPTPTDAAALVLGMEELIRRTVGPEIQLNACSTTGLWSVLVDANQLESTLLNLCLNARDAMPGGGTIDIETRNTTLDAGAAAGLELAPGDYVHFSVVDDGSGMPPDVIAHAFEPFFTTKPMGEGTGLGLSMAYGFVRQSGGQMRIDSRVGEGTRMCFYLPRHLASESSSRIPLAAALPGSGSGASVLVVDDEPMIRALVVEVLQDSGYRVLSAADGAEALSVLRSMHDIELLITDVGLPGINGRQVADAARTLNPALTVLFITGYAEQSVIGRSVLEPGMHLLTKPFSVELLLDKVQQLSQETRRPLRDPGR